MGLMCTSVASAGSQVVRAGMLVQLASCLVLRYSRASLSVPRQHWSQCRVVVTFNYQ
ncbi:hypothetical protein E2C01_023125 [Portunus trituberculatus]|uniref:Uncharacterized protein n=1 Tax=Portunus trituberculatus TaxID=210409 RepID=A0A5B7EAB8_PORTR|nr:hypothetical protein [Portunus trituberculatus]